jgi:hypothetical protein
MQAQQVRHRCITQQRATHADEGADPHPTALGTLCALEWSTKASTATTNTDSKAHVLWRSTGSAPWCSPRLRIMDNRATQVETICKCAPYGAGEALRLGVIRERVLPVRVTLEREAAAADEPRLRLLVIVCTQVRPVKTRLHSRCLSPSARPLLRMSRASAFWSSSAYAADARFAHLCIAGSMRHGLVGLVCLRQCCQCSAVSATVAQQALVRNSTQPARRKAGPQLETHA